MKLLGLLGGMSWESTLRYYQKINEGIRERMGGLHSANLILRSVDFAEIKELQASGSWDEAAELLGKEMRALESAGADAVLICTNTMHCIANEVMQGCTVPLIHIGDVVGDVCQQQKYSVIGLLGTRYTMEQPFLKDRLESNFGLQVIVPDEEDRQEVHRVIYDELCKGRVIESSQNRYSDVVMRLSEKGAEAVVFGCTEIEMLFRDRETSIPSIDTTRVHADAAIEFLLN